MNERIKRLVDRTVNGEKFISVVPTQYDRTDLFLSPVKMSGKRVCEYILNQEPQIDEDTRFTGFFRFDGTVEGEIFNRKGHKNFSMLWENFYNKPVENLVTMEWQHSTGNYKKVIGIGLKGIKQEILDSLKNHKGEPEKIEFLETQLDLVDTLVKWAHKCSKRAFELASSITNSENKKGLIKLSETLLRVPENPATSFYEAVQTVFMLYSLAPDSIGLADRYFYKYYIDDINNGIMTKEEAGEYLQELFLMLQARIPITSDRFYRGGESHFCVGGYNEQHEDNFNELSRLIIDSLLDLPTWIPQISLRWTKKTSREVFRYVMDKERKDPNKRIAFVNDEPRINGLMKFNNIPFETAVNYSMIGCNEITLPGGVVYNFDMVNILRSVENTFKNRKDEILNVNNFDEFYAIYEQELFSDLTRGEKICEHFQHIRARDCNIVSNILFDGCIERGISMTQGGLSKISSLYEIIGISNVIDSLAVVNQFVFDEKMFDMNELIDALEKDWSGYEDMLLIIKKKAHYFGNDDDDTNAIAKRFFDSIVKWNDGNNELGLKHLFGNLIGYNQHNVFFGHAMGATPDGRHKGEMMNFGIGQTGGRDRNGLTALACSIAKCDPNNVMVGPSVSNFLLDKKLIFDEDNFEKTVDIFETYFKMGATHYQLSYIDMDDLKKAQISPEEYKNLRVRVSGFSDYFVLLNKDLQDEFIQRTTQYNS